MCNLRNVRVTVWNEYAHEKSEAKIAAVYPDGMHAAIADALRKNPELTVRTATLNEPGCGLGGDVLEQTDVLTWWGHMRHGDVPDELVNRVYRRVQEGMGLIALHSSHASKIFSKLCGTESANLKWRESDDKEILWVTDPNHPIVAGLGKDHIVLEKEETYGEHFDIPTPDEIVFISWFSGGEVFRSGVTYKRGLGRVFYFRPGHESFPTFYNEDILKVIENACFWCAEGAYVKPDYGHYMSVV